MSSFWRLQQLRALHQACDPRTSASAPMFRVARGTLNPGITTYTIGKHPIHRASKVCKYTLVAASGVLKCCDFPAAYPSNGTRSPAAVSFVAPLLIVPLLAGGGCILDIFH